MLVLDWFGLSEVNRRASGRGLGPAAPSVHPPLLLLLSCLGRVGPFPLQNSNTPAPSFAPTSEASCIPNAASPSLEFPC